MQQDCTFSLSSDEIVLPLSIPIPTQHSRPEQHRRRRCCSCAANACDPNPWLANVRRDQARSWLTHWERRVLLSSSCGRPITSSSYSRQWKREGVWEWCTSLTLASQGMNDACCVFLVWEVWGATSPELISWLSWLIMGRGINFWQGPCFFFFFFYAVHLLFALNYWVHFSSMLFFLTA